MVEPDGWRVIGNDFDVYVSCLFFLSFSLSCFSFIQLILFGSCVTTNANAQSLLRKMFNCRSSHNWKTSNRTGKKAILQDWNVKQNCAMQVLSTVTMCVFPSLFFGCICTCERERESEWMSVLWVVMRQINLCVLLSTVTFWSLYDWNMTWTSLNEWICLFHFFFLISLSRMCTHLHSHFILSSTSIFKHFIYNFLLMEFLFLRLLVFFHRENSCWIHHRKMFSNFIRHFEFKQRYDWIQSQIKHAVRKYFHDKFICDQLICSEYVKWGAFLALSSIKWSRWLLFFVPSVCLSIYLSLCVCVFSSLWKFALMSLCHLIVPFISQLVT